MAPVFTVATALGIAHARVTLARHCSPNLRTGCQIIATQQLDSLTVSSTHYVFNNYTPAQRSWRGVYWIHPVRPPVRLSVDDMVSGA